MALPRSESVAIPRDEKHITSKGGYKVNRDIRALIVQKGVKQWLVAKELGMLETSFSRLLRYELTPDRRKQIIAAVEKLAQNGGGGRG